MVQDIALIIARGAAIALLFAGIKHNEKKRRRSMSFMPGGKTILAAMYILIIEYAITALKLLFHYGL